MSPVDLGLPINSGGALHAHIAPDKSYILFNSPRTGSFTDLDIWVSFSKPDGSWTIPQNAGKTINSGADAILCPKVTPDGKFLFFTKRNKSTGTGLVYWVSASFVDSLRIVSGMKKLSTGINPEVFPNPSDGLIYVVFDQSPIKHAIVTTFNLKGTVVFSQVFHNITYAKIDLSKFKPGTYLLRSIIEEESIHFNKISLR